MFIFAIIITSFLEQKMLLVNLRQRFQMQVNWYIEYFIKRNFKTASQIRYTYFIALVPIIIILLVLKFILSFHLAFVIIYKLINLLLFILTINVLTWKQIAKNTNSQNDYHFITHYATHFFAALFWYLILPSALGSISYMIIMSMSAKLKNKGLDIIVYDMVVDKLLFYINVFPYLILFIFIAMAGDFETSIHHLITKFKSFTPSFYFLDKTLKEMTLISIGKDKFKLDIDENTKYEIYYNETADLTNEHFTPEIKSYIIAILYRTSIFYIGLLIILKFASML